MSQEFQKLEFTGICEKIASLAISAAGQELALKIRPVRDTSRLTTWLTQTTELLNLIEYDSSPPLDGLGDIRSSLNKLKIQASSLSLGEISGIYSTLTVIRSTEKYFRARKEKAPLLFKLASRLKPLPAVEKELERCIDFKSGEMKDGASPRLAHVRGALRQARINARKKLNALLKSYGSQGMLQENVISVRDGRFVLVVRDEYKRKIKGLIHDQSASGSSYFIEPLETLDDNNRIRELEADEFNEMQLILAGLSDLLRNSWTELDSNVDILTRFDLVNAKALFARSIEALQPEIVEETVVELYEARHPLLLQRIGKKDVVPITLKLGKETNTLVISGPNAGGKTVALKTVGLLTLMARSGLLIPALPHSQIGAIDQVFACIGDQQSIENDLSTFSSHIKDLKDIVDRATPRSLVLVDEIASGTDPEEGTALAMSFIEHVAVLGSLNIVTTHLSALKAFAYRADGVENASLEFDIHTLQPTFQFRIGIPGSSYAFEIARRLGLGNITERARALIGDQKNRFEGLILELEDKLHEQKQLVARTNLKELELGSLIKLYSEKKEEIEKYQKHYKRQAVEQADRIIQEANAAIEQAIKEIRESHAERQVVKTARKKIAEQKEKIAKAKKAAQTVPAATPEDFKIGDYVKWTMTGSIGTIASEPDKHHRVYVQAGATKIKVPVSELVRAKKPAPRRPVVKANLSEKQGYSGQLDLRGDRLEEARQKVDHFLDEAILTGLKEVRIIHGKGTGSLRKGLGKFLQSHPFVVNTRLGNWNEGDSGVTVVELREE